MEKMALFLLGQYAQMSGDKKVRIALNLSKTVRQVRKEGIAATQKRYANRSSSAS